MSHAPFAYVVKRIPRWRTEGDALVLDDPRGGAPTRLAKSASRLLDAIAQGATGRALHEALPDARPGTDDAEARVRRMLLHLHRLGYVELPLDPPTLPPPYELVGELGRGGVGVAWRCLDRERGAHVVVKRAWSYTLPLDAADAALRREAAALARFDHAGIVRAIGSFEQAGRFHLVRELVEGAELAMHHRSPLDEAGARDALRQACAAVAHAHERGMVLVDVRPSNFIRAPDGRVVVMDVGHAREAPSGEVALDGISGAPGFLPPEMVTRRVASFAGDVWALGALYAFLRKGAPTRTLRARDHASGLDGRDAELVARLCAEPPEARPAAGAAARLFA